MGSEQVWTLTDGGAEHRVEASGATRHVIRWSVDGEPWASRTTLDDTVRLSADDRPERLVVRFSTMGTPRRATLRTPDDEIDLVPTPGSPAAAYEARVLERPQRHALLAALGGVVKVVGPLLLGLIAVRVAVHVPWPELPSIPWPDLPSAPFPEMPSVPLPDLPSVNLPDWVGPVLDVVTYVWPVVLAYVLARAEIRRRRREQARRRGGSDAPTQERGDSGTDGVMRRITDVQRMGYGAMQLSGPHIFGPPADPAEAARVLVRALDLGIDHIDTSDYYGPYVTNDLIRDTLHPYAPELVIVTKVGARRDDEGNWLPDFSPEAIRRQVHDNLGRLGIDRIGGVNLRLMSPDDDLRGQWEVLAELQSEGLIGSLGLSTVSLEQVRTAQEIAPVDMVQNEYNIANRADEQLILDLDEQGIKYVPYFPLGGFSPLDLTELDKIAAKYDATGRQVALAWLLQHSPNILLIPGTSTVSHLEQNVEARNLVLSDEDVHTLDHLHPPTPVSA